MLYSEAITALSALPLFLPDAAAAVKVRLIALLTEAW